MVRWLWESLSLRQFGVMALALGRKPYFTEVQDFRRSEQAGFRVHSGSMGKDVRNATEIPRGQQRESRAGRGPELDPRLCPAPLSIPGAGLSTARVGPGHPPGQECWRGLFGGGAVGLHLAVHRADPWLWALITEPPFRSSESTMEGPAAPAVTGHYSMGGLRAEITTAQTGRSLLPTGAGTRHGLACKLVRGPGN